MQCTRSALVVHLGQMNATRWTGPRIDWDRSYTMVDVDNGRRLACMSTSALVDYALLVASSACFARVKSRSSLCPDSLSHQRER